MKSILITGGSGFIGSHTILELLKNDSSNNIIVLDNLKNGHEKALKIIEKETNSKIKIYKGDLLNKENLEKVFSQNKIDIVIHFAALIEAGVSVTNPTKFYENNISGSINLFKQMQQSKVNKIVFSSTAAVYGTPESEEVTEENPLHPESPYGYSKLVVENILRSLDTKEVDENERIKSVILRYFNAAGANPKGLIGQDYPKPTHLMTVAIETALGFREKLVIFGNDYKTPDGTCIRDYIHVEDLANAHVKALEYLDINNQSNIFNIGTGVGVSNLELVYELEKIHGRFNFEFGPKRIGDPSAYYANNSKAKSILNWEPKYSLKDTILHAYQWKKNNPNGFIDIII